MSSFDLQTNVGPGFLRRTRLLQVQDPDCQSHIVGSELGSRTSFLLFMARFSLLSSAEDGPAETTTDSRVSNRGSNPEVGPAISLLANHNY